MSSAFGNISIDGEWEHVLLRLLQLFYFGF